MSRVSNCFVIIPNYCKLTSNSFSSLLCYNKKIKQILKFELMYIKF